MWIAILAAAGVVLTLLVLLGRRSPAPSPTTASKLPRLASADEDEDLTVAARILTREDSRRLAAAVSPEHASDEEDDDQTGVQRMILVNAVARTDTGLLRKHNEDHFLVLDEYDLFVVADGMGGHAGGEVASTLATDTIARVFRAQEFGRVRKVTSHRRANELVRALELANEEIRRVAAAKPELADMGTTCVAARFSGGRQRLYIASAGDSRMYRVRDAEIKQLTTDHTLAVEAGVKGTIGAQLTRALGISDSVQPAVVVEEARPGDRYVLCSDGLTKMLTDAEIRDVVVKGGLKESAKRLVAMSNDRGGRDNITVILVKVEPA